MAKDLLLSPCSSVKVSPEVQQHFSLQTQGVLSVFPWCSELWCRTQSLQAAMLLPHQCSWFPSHRHEGAVPSLEQAASPISALPFLLGMVLSLFRPVWRCKVLRS